MDRPFGAFPVAGLALLLSLIGGVVRAQTESKAAPAHPVDGSFVREWLILGPFSSKILETDFLEEAGGEGNVRPKEGDTVRRGDGTVLTWTRFRSDYDIVNLEKVLGIQPWSVAYAYCELTSDRPMNTDILPPFNSSLLWLNGEQIVSKPPLSGHPGNVPQALPIQLNAGPNPCLFKLKVETEEWTFSVKPLPQERARVELRATDSEGRPIPDALIQFYDQGEPVWRLRTGPTGQAEATLYPVARAYDLRLTAGEHGVWLHDLVLQPGERRNLDLVLTQAVSISGSVLALDGSPQNAVVVQALRDPDSSWPGSAGLPAGKESGRAAQPSILTFDGLIPSLLPKPLFSETVLSDTNGNFRFVNLRPGSYRLRCHGPNGFVYPDGRQASASTPPIIVVSGRTNAPIPFVYPRAKKGVWRNHTVTKGLVEVSPRCVHRGPDGMLWVGSDSGALHSYDGVEFIRFQAPQIPGNLILDIDHDPKGVVWAATSSGVTRMTEGRFQPLPQDARLPRDWVSSIVPNPDGSVWLGTASGLCKYEEGKLAVWGTADGLPANYVPRLMRDREGALWMSTKIGLARFEDGTSSVHVTLPPFSLMMIEGFYQAQDGAIWMCTPDPAAGGAYRFDGSVLRRIGTEDGLLDDRVFDIAQTSDGDLWFATGKGLSRFNGTTFLNYTLQDGLSNEWVRDIFVDEDDVLWLANGWGVSRFDPNGFVGFADKDGVKNIIDDLGSTVGVFALEPDTEGGFWVGTQWGGVFRIRQSGRHPTLESAFSEEGYVREIHRAADGTLWFGGSSGIHKLEGNALTKVLSRNWIIALTSDDQGRLWFGHGWNGGGLSRYDPATGAESVFTRAQGLPDDYIWSLERDPGRGVWIGTGGGLARASGDHIENGADMPELPGAAVFDLRRDANDALWLGTARGLHWLESQAKHASITSTNGLPDEHVWSSARTPDGIIWIGTANHGLIGYDGTAMTVLDKRDGLVGNSAFALAPHADKSLWVGFLDGGLTRYRRTQSRPSIRLLTVGSGDQTLTNTSRLPQIETGHSIRIQFQEIDLKTHPEKRQFQYRLATASGQTMETGVIKDRRVEYTPTKGGTYHFEVQAIDRDLNYSEPARLQFRATVPWHANAWVTVPGGGAIAGLLLWALVARVLYVQKRRELDRLHERARIARDLHDHLGSGLTHVALLGDFVRQQTDPQGTTQALARQLSESALELARTMGEVIWATDPAKDTLRGFLSFVSIHAEKFFAGSTLRLRLDFPADLPEVLLPSQLRHSLFMVAKEALNNVAKHAQASEVRIQVKLIDHELRLGIQDDGCGFLRMPQATHEDSDRHGLGNMEKRLNDLGGQLLIQSVPGQGTRIEARVPLPKK